MNGSMNGVRVQSQLVRKKMKEAGLIPGIPDISLPVPRSGYHGLYIELKRKKWRDKDGKIRYSSTSKDQVKVIAFLRENGYRVDICEGADEAKKAIVGYLEGDLWEGGTKKG